MNLYGYLYIYIPLRNDSSTSSISIRLKSFSYGLMPAAQVQPSTFTRSGSDASSEWLICRVPHGDLGSKTIFKAHVFCCVIRLQGGTARESCQTGTSVLFPIQAWQFHPHFTDVRVATNMLEKTKPHTWLRTKCHIDIANV